MATAADLAKKAITAQQPTNTWVWTASDISDVTFGLSDHYVWDAASVVVDAEAKRRASVQAAFADSTKDFHSSVKFGAERAGLVLEPHNWPGVPYPFPKMTAFQGFADMEYPMMVNDSPQDDLHFAQLVQDHEIAHTYFPFYMGINESRYAFMDEGWATTFELLIGRAENGVATADEFYKKFRVNRWIHDPSTAAGPAHHHAQQRAARRLRQQLLRQSLAQLPGPEGHAGRCALQEEPCTSTWTAGTASTPFRGTISTR